MTTDAEYGNKIAPASLSTDSPEYHYQTGFAEPNTAAARTMFGFTSSGVSFMVVTKALNSIKADAAAAFMKELGCYYAVFLDGGGSTEMHEKSVYTENWSTIYTSTRKKQTALFAYQP